MIGKAELDDLLSNREKLGAELTEIIDAPSEQPWGVKVERVEVKDVTLPESMKRSMSRQAEAERERRARVISADGEFQASKKLAQAAATMSADPAALQLRLLQTVAEVAAEKNSTLVMPFPVELLRFLERVTPDRTGTVQFPPDGLTGPEDPAEPVAPPDEDPAALAGLDPDPADPAALAGPYADPAALDRPDAGPAALDGPGADLRGVGRPDPDLTGVGRPDADPAGVDAAAATPPMPADTVETDDPVSPATVNGRIPR